MSRTGYLYAVICAAAQILTHIVMGFCLGQLLTERGDRKYRTKRNIVWIASGSVILGMKCLMSLPAALLAVLNPVVLNLFYLFFLKYFCKDKWRTKLFHFAMLLMQSVLADIIYQSVWGYLVGNEIWDIPFRHQAFAESCIVIAAISIMLNIIYTMIVLSVRRRKRIKINVVWIAMILFFVLMLLAILVIRQTSSAAGEGGQPYFIFICIFTIMEFATVMIFLSQAEKQEAQNEKRAAQEEVRRLQQVMELEK